MVRVLVRVRAGLPGKELVRAEALVELLGMALAPVGQRGRVGAPAVVPGRGRVAVRALVGVRLRGRAGRMVVGRVPVGGRVGARGWAVLGC